MRIVLLNKPYGVLSQFTDRSHRPTLADYIPIPDIYPIGRLDCDSEGLLVLTDNGRLQNQISQPRYQYEKVYWVQVEGIPSPPALTALAQGVHLRDGWTAPARVQLLDESPVYWPRDPPIRYRATIPTTWLAITLYEGRNRQVRRMTAAVGHPTLRLVRWAVGEWTLAELPPGAWRWVSPARRSFVIPGKRLEYEPKFTTSS